MRNYVKHGLSRSRLYRTWANMKQRCYNPKAHEYNSYGGRGIDVCKEWRENFCAFFRWAMENGYDETLTIDRIDNNKGYAPENCRWATKTQQYTNMRPRKVSNNAMIEKYTTERRAFGRWPGNRSIWVCIDGRYAFSIWNCDKIVVIDGEEVVSSEFFK